MPNVGDIIHDFRGDPWKFVTVTGDNKVVVDPPDGKEGMRRHFYPSVFPDTDFSAG